LVTSSETLKMVPDEDKEGIKPKKVDAMSFADRLPLKNTLG